MNRTRGQPVIMNDKSRSKYFDNIGDSKSLGHMEKGFSTLRDANSISLFQLEINKMSRQQKHKCQGHRLGRGFARWVSGVS